MPRHPRRRLAPAAFAILALAGLGATAPAHAGVTDTCFNFLVAQDYFRALQEATALVKRRDLSEADTRLAYLCTGRTLSSSGHSRDALTAFERVEALSRSTRELATAYSWLGATHKNLGDLDRSEFYTQRALKGARELGDKSSEAANLNNLAMIVEERGDPARALVLYQEALALEPNEARKPAKLNNIALIHNDRGEFAEAARLLRQALDISRRSGDSHGAAVQQLNLGDTLRKQGDLAGAERELTAGLKAVQLLGDQGWEATACTYLAWLANDRKDMKAARDWYRKAETIYRGLGQTAEADDMTAKANAHSKDNTK